MVEEEAVGHKVAGVEDDGGQHVEKECVWGERGDVYTGGDIEKQADHHPHRDQQAGLWEHLAQPRRHVEPCNNETADYKICIN